MAPEWDSRGEGGWGQVQHQFHLSLNISSTLGLRWNGEYRYIHHDLIFGPLEIQCLNVYDHQILRLHNCIDHQTLIGLTRTSKLASQCRRKSKSCIAFF